MKPEKKIRIALVGNPNSGKTTLFNRVSHSREHVGNYAGVTVDSKEALFNHRGYTFRITDLPGTYSLSDYTSEERYVREHILKNKPDVVVNVLDANFYASATKFSHTKKFFSIYVIRPGF